MELILRQSGHDPNKPYILLTGPTGTSASSINGMTLHSTFGFNFGNNYISLSDKNCDKKRSELSNLVALIRDEGSMVKADLLYQLDLRLKEVKEEPRCDFGGVAVWIFCDLLQLPPVRASFIFQIPKCTDYHIAFHLASLWESVTVINPTYNHRQGNDKSYAELLNRLRIGEATKEDFDLLKSRVRPAGHPDLTDDEIFIACTNATVNEINQKCVNALAGTGVTLSAINLEGTNGSFIPYQKWVCS